MVLENNFPPDERVEKEIGVLQKLGAEVSVACLILPKAPQRFETLDGVMIFRKKMSKLMHNTHIGSLTFPFYFNWWRKYLKNIFTENDFDALHIHDLPLARVGIEMRDKFGLRLIVDTHENWPSDIKYARHTNTFIGRLLSPHKLWVDYEKTILGQVDIVITVVKEMKDRIVDLGIPESKVVVIQNLIDISRFDKRIGQKKSNAKSPIVYYGGGVNVHRGVQIAIRAMPEILKIYPEAKLWVIGGGSYLGECIELAKKLGLVGNIYFSGQVSQQILWSKMLEADICIIPHMKFEQTDCSSPNKIYQYMWAGKPILTSNCNSLKRIVAETQTGLSYVHDSHQELSSAVVKLWSDKALYCKFAQNGPVAIMNGLNWQAEATDVMRKIYNFK